MRKPARKKASTRPRKASRKAIVKPAPRKRKNPKAARRRNSDDAAESAKALYEQFHGKPSTGFRTYEEPDARPTDLAHLGKLVELIVWIDEDHIAELAPKGVKVTATGEGGNIYFIGGDQTLDLASVEREEGTQKNHVLIGPVEAIAYQTSKDFHDFEPTIYEHTFGEETGEQPWLCYDTRNKRLYLIGGAYRVRRPGIEN